MSNTEERPAETVCAAGAGSGAGIQLIEPRDVPLGGLRAMNVRRTLPQRARSLIGAWCFLDHYGPDHVADTGGMNVDAHPHIGLQTASWLFAGEIEHRDSAGFHAMVRPGELNLMTAGHGISHSERSTAATDVLHGAQLWIALPAASRNTAKTFAHYEPPVVRGDGWHGQVFLGSLLGSESPVETHTPLVGAELTLAPGATIRIACDPAFEHGILLDNGSVSLVRHAAEPAASEQAPHDATDPGAEPHAAPVRVARDALAYAATGAVALELEAGDDGAHLLLIGGTPFEEQIVMWWNFVGRDHDEIARARADWQAQIAAVGVADVAVADAPGDAVAASGAAVAPEAGPVDAARFGLPDHEPAPPLSAPPLPLARLVPRER